jgi:hypothetical protein
MLELGKGQDAGKFATSPMQQWFRDLTTPFFLRLFGNPKAYDRVYSYRVDWDASLVASPPSAGEKRHVVSHSAIFN